MDCHTFTVSGPTSIRASEVKPEDKLPGWMDGAWAVDIENELGCLHIVFESRLILMQELASMILAASPAGQQAQNE